MAKFNPSNTESPDLEVDGEMQADVALDAEKRLMHFPFTSLRHNANILIFADLQSSVICP